MSVSIHDGDTNRVIFVDISQFERESLPKNDSCWRSFCCCVWCCASPALSGIDAVPPEWILRFSDQSKAPQGRGSIAFTSEEGRLIACSPEEYNQESRMQIYLDNLNTGDGPKAWNHIEICLTRLGVWERELSTELQTVRKEHHYPTMQLLRDLGKRVGVAVVAGPSKKGE